MTASVELGRVQTSPQVRGFVVGLVGGIMAGVGLALGAAFVVIGLASDTADADALGTVGWVALAAGALSAALAIAGRAWWRRRAAAEEAARTARATVDVIGVSVRESSRVGNRNPIRLTVRMPPTLGGPEQVARWIYAIPPPGLRPGATIDVAYAPANPANFAPAQPVNFVLGLKFLT